MFDVKDAVICKNFFDNSAAFLIISLIEQFEVISIVLTITKKFYLDSMVACT